MSFEFSNCDQFQTFPFVRFFTALALQELVNEKSISEVSAKYKIHRGLLQNLQQLASAFAGTVVTFCKSLQWNLLAVILSQFRERLFFGIHPDLIDLMKIPSIGGTRVARALYKSGIEKLSDLANSKTLAVENVLMDLGESFFVVGKSLGMSVPEVAKLMINDARTHIRNENGLRDVMWTQEPVIDSTVEAGNEVEPTTTNQPEVKSPEIKSLVKASQNDVQRKRKVEISRTSTDSTTGGDKNNEVKKIKIDLDTSFNYRKKLRSSGGAEDFDIVNTQFMMDLDEKAEAAQSTANKTDDNASLFKMSDNDMSNENASLLELTQQHLQIIDVMASEQLFEQFTKDMREQSEVAMSVGVQKFEILTQKIGGNLLKPAATQNKCEHNFIFDGTFFIDCISFCYNSNRVCYMNLQKSESTATKAKKFISELLQRNDLTVRIYEAREHLKSIQKAFNMGGEVAVKIQDPRVASWIVDPDKNLNWHEMVSEYAGEQIGILELASKHSTVSSLGIAHNLKVDPKVRTSVECFLVNQILLQQLQKIENTGKARKGQLLRVMRDLEMPIQLVLMRMELTGFPINVQKLQRMIEETTLKQRLLEQHIYQLNGRKFNLSSSLEVSKVVGIHRNLERNRRVSTAKNVLEKLDLPIANCIMTWRTLSKTIANIQPMTKLAKNGRIHGNSFSLTQTGRISMYEPNLQNVTKDFDINFKGEF